HDALPIWGSNDEMPHSLVVDHQNNLVIAGKTYSSNFPVTASAYDNTFNGLIDIYVAKLNPTGTALIASTFIGGTGNDGINVSDGFNANQNSLKYNYGDDSRSEVIVDKTGNIYVVASTQSTNFPTTPTAAKAFLGGTQDGVFVKFNPQLNTLLYSTYIGGNSEDAAYVLALDTAEANVFIAGGTRSTDFHSNVTSGSYRSTYQGGLADGYICKFQNGGTYP